MSTSKRIDMQRLIREYRGQKAPADMSIRVQSQTDDMEPSRFGWKPLAAAMSFVAAIVIALPLLLDGDAPANGKQARPSMTAIRAMPAKPSTPAHRMMKIKSVTIPALPRKPARQSDRDSQTHSDPDDRIDYMKELEYEFV